MSRSALPRPSARRVLAAAALVVALPLTTAAGCQDEGEDGPGMEQEDDRDAEDGVEQEDGTDQEDDGEGDD
nr:hypothetical protein [uncultured Actinotalea sp.]